MSVRLSAIDEEIQQLEERIARDRAEFVAALGACGDSVRETASSPKALLAVAGLGFVAGKLLFRSGGKAKAKESASAPSKLGGMLGLLASGLSLMQPASGAGGLARWAAQQWWERRSRTGAPGARRQPAAARATRATTAPRGDADSATPQVRMPPRGTSVHSPATTASVRY